MSKRGYGLYYESFDNIIGEEVLGRSLRYFMERGCGKSDEKDKKLKIGICIWRTVSLKIISKLVRNPKCQ